MEFPKIYDFDEVDTVPSALMDVHDFQTHDVRSNPRSLKFGPGSSPAEVIGRKYPRILQCINAGWGSQTLQDTFTRWLLTDQEGRRGWPIDVHTALMELSNAHAAIFNLEGNVFWGGRPDRW